MGLLHALAALVGFIAAGSGAKKMGEQEKLLKEILEELKKISKQNRKLIAFEIWSAENRGYDTKLINTVIKNTGGVNPEKELFKK